MLTVYHRVNDKIVISSLSGDATLPQDIAWVDGYDITLREAQMLEEQLGISVPTHDEIWKNRVLSRFYEEGGNHYMTAAIITKVNSPQPQTSSVTFIISKHFLVTIRQIAPTSFHNFADWLMLHPQKFKTSSQVLEGLLNEMITRVAHNSEIVVKELDRLSYIIFSQENERNNKSHISPVGMEEVIRTMGGNGRPEYQNM